MKEAGCRKARALRGHAEPSDLQGLWPHPQRRAATGTQAPTGGHRAQDAGDGTIRTYDDNVGVARHKHLSLGIVLRPVTRGIAFNEWEYLEHGTTQALTSTTAPFKDRTSPITTSRMKIAPVTSVPAHTPQCCCHVLHALPSETRHGDFTWCEVA